MIFQRNKNLLNPVYNALDSVEAVVQRCSLKNAFLEISQNSQENTCACFY